MKTHTLLLLPFSHGNIYIACNSFDFLEQVYDTWQENLPLFTCTSYITVNMHLANSSRSSELGLQGEGGTGYFRPVFHVWVDIWETAFGSHKVPGCYL